MSPGAVPGSGATAAEELGVIFSLAELSAIRHAWADFRCEWGFVDGWCNTFGSGQAHDCAEYLEICGPVHPAVFEAALRQAVADAEALYTGDAWSLPVLDVSAEPDPRAAAESWMQAELASPAGPAGPGATQAQLFSYALVRHLRTGSSGTSGTTRSLWMTTAGGSWPGGVAELCPRLADGQDGGAAGLRRWPSTGRRGGQLPGIGPAWAGSELLAEPLRRPARPGIPGLPDGRGAGPGTAPDSIVRRKARRHCVPPHARRGWAGSGSYWRPARPTCPG